MYPSDLNWNMRIYFSFYIKKYLTMFMILVFLYFQICSDFAKDGSHRSILWRTFCQNIHLKPNIFNVLEKAYHNSIDTFSIFRNVLIWEGWVIVILWRTFLWNRHFVNRYFIFCCCSMCHIVAKLDTPVNQSFETNFEF